MMQIDQYLSYEISMLIGLLHEHRGTFSMNEMGHWVATVRPHQYQGKEWDSSSFRHAYSYLINRVDSFAPPEDDEDHAI